MTHSDTAALWIAVGASSLLFAILGCALAVIRSRTMSVIVRAIATASLIVMCVTAPLLVDWLFGQVYATKGILRAYVDPGPLQMWLPAVCGIAAYVLAWKGTKRAMRPV